MCTWREGKAIKCGGIDLTLDIGSRWKGRMLERLRLFSFRFDGIILQSKPIWISNSTKGRVPGPYDRTKSYVCFSTQQTLKKISERELMAHRTAEMVVIHQGLNSLLLTSPSAEAVFLLHSHTCIIAIKQFRFCTGLPQNGSLPL